MPSPASSLCHRAAILAAILSATAARAGEDASACAALQDDARRLACYDLLFRPAPAEGAAGAQAAGASSGAALGQADAAGGAATAGAAAATPVATASSPEPTPSPEGRALSDAISQYWELTPVDKRGTFVVRTFQPNVFLPAHYTTRMNRAPYSPSQGYGNRQLNDRDVGARLQVSLRTKVAEDLLLPGGDVWFAYTQTSVWQLWNRDDSSPFRSTDHEPQVMYVAPAPGPLARLPFGWRWRMWQVAFAHQSNGQSAPLSRSWNRFYVGAAATRDNVALQLRMNNRTAEAGQDDNPGLTRYIGNTELALTWQGEVATTALTWRTHLPDLRRGSLQLEWSRPVQRDKADGLRWYVRLFTGYGDTLLDYNHHQTALGLGMSVLNF